VQARLLGRNRELAAALWDKGWYEARLLTSMVDEPAPVTPQQMAFASMPFTLELRPRTKRPEESGRGRQECLSYKPRCNFPWKVNSIESLV